MLYTVSNIISTKKLNQQYLTMLIGVVNLS